MSNANNSLNRSTCSGTSEVSAPTYLTDELSTLLDRVEERIERVRDDLRASRTAKPVAPVSPVRSGLSRLLGRSRKGDFSTPERSKSAASPSPSPLRPAEIVSGPLSNFIPFSKQEEFVEDLRRAAELCIIGENFAAKVQKKEETANERSKQKWAAARDALMDDVSESEPAYDTEEEQNEKMQLFDLFFERNALAMIVDMLYGESFRIDSYPAEDTVDPNCADDSEQRRGVSEVETLLPPLAIATQALQSISILIQNVSKATSLYVILSNNYINKLINFPMHLYMTAEKRRLIASRESKALPSTFASPQITELATHFVTFLKSLAMRMNAETLQFFLTYASDENGGPNATSAAPLNHDDSSSSVGLQDDDSEKVPKVEFPLYLRALDFCAAHHDSFVRTTAMNICLNTLRLTTIVGNDEADEKSVGGSISSPDGVLHNAKALPFRERAAIARYACIPSRVELLIAPIFTKLAERWTALDEQINAIDSNKHMGFGESMDGEGRHTERLTMAKEKVRREKLIRGFRDRVADLQDELLLLDDVFKVGLTVLNEQLVETMLATFVYPMLLQPLVIYCQHLTSSVDEDRFSYSEHPFGGISADLSDVDKALLSVSSSAKTAIFTLASVFKFLSNRALLRLLFTALFHPLSPDSSTAPTVRSRLEVAARDSDGRKCLRLDRPYTLGELIPDERTTYDFGTSPMSRRLSKLTTNSGDDSTEACVFVLAPALAEVLEYRGEDMALIARTRPSPYRRALLKCLTVPEDMSDIRELTICAVSAALASFEGSFGSRTLLGTDLKTFDDDIPADERNLESAYAHMDDRGIGGGAKFESRRTFGLNGGTNNGSDHVLEIVSALCCCVIFARRVAADEWKLGYNYFAAYALLTIVEKNKGAIVAASKILDHRRCQAALVLAEVPSGGLNPMGGSSIMLPGSPSINVADYEERMFGSFLNLVFYDAFTLGGTPLADVFLRPMDAEGTNQKQEYYIEISNDSDLDSLHTCVGAFLLVNNGGTGLREFDIEMVEERRESGQCWLKVDALVNLLKDTSASTSHSVRNVAMSLHGHPSTGNLYSYISPDTKDYLFKSTDDDLPLSQSVISLEGLHSIPCVCEVAGPASALFVDASSGGLVSEGVTWQSLNMVFIPRQSSQLLLLVQSLSGDDNGKGRVISVCKLERLTVERDEVPPDDGSPARRLSLYHTWYDQLPPLLFLFDAMPVAEEHGSFTRVKPFVSRLDVWFENDYVADQSSAILSSLIFTAKSLRGRRMQSNLDPQGEHTGSIMN